MGIVLRTRRRTGQAGCGALTLHAAITSHAEHWTRCPRTAAASSLGRVARRRRADPAGYRSRAPRFQEDDKGPAGQESGACDGEIDGGSVMNRTSVAAPLRKRIA